MPGNIEDRIVRMQFENSAFLKGVEQTFQSLTKLDAKLKLPGAKKGFGDLESAANKVNLSAISDQLGRLTDEFTLFGQVGVQSITRIASRLVDMGSQMISSITIDPLKDGFREYQLQMDSIQTILTNTKKYGTTIDDVNRTLGELNTYADQTIYNFGDMTSAIGKFTAAGVDLDRSTIAIKGISNLAAGSGASAQDAARAMYQLSQAMSAGVVKLQDWNSVVNANMGGQVFQDSLIQTARDYGVAVDDIIAKQGSFRESLSEGWLTADILTETLKRFTVEGAAGLGEFWETQAKAFQDAATQIKSFPQLIDVVKEELGSGWATSWTYVMGNFEEAKELWTRIGTPVTGFISDLHTARNAILEFWHDAGGRTDVVEGIFALFRGIGSFIKPVADAFNQFFGVFEKVEEEVDGVTKTVTKLTPYGQKLADGFISASKAFRSFTESFGASSGLQSIIGHVATAFFGLVRGAVDLAGSGLSVVLGGIASALRVVGFAISVVANIVGDLFLPIFDRMGKALVSLPASLMKDNAAIKAFGEASTGVKAGLSGMLTAFTDFTYAASEGKATVGSLNATLDKVGASAGTVWDVLKHFGSEFDSYLAGVQRSLLAYGPIGQVLSQVVGAVRAAGTAIGSVAEVLANGWGRAWSDGLDPLRQWLTLMGSLVVAVSQFFVELGTVGTSPVDAVMHLFTNVTTAMDTFHESVANAAPVIVSRLLAMTDALAESGPVGYVLATVLRGLGGVLMTLANAFKFVHERVSTVKDVIGSHLADAFGRAKESVAPFLDSITSVGDRLRKAGITLDTFGRIFDHMIEAVGTFFDDLSNGMSFSDALGKLFGSLGTYLDRLRVLFQIVGNTIASVFAPVLERLQPVLSYLQEKLGPAADALSALWRGFKDTAISLATSALGAFVNAISAAQDKFGSFGPTVDAIIGKIRDFYGTLKANASSKLDISNPLAGILGAGDKVGGAISQFAGGVVSGIKGAIDTIRGALDQISVGRIVAFFEGVLLAGVAIGAARFFHGINNIVSSLGKVAKTFADFGAKLSKSLVGITDGVGGLFKSFGKAIEDVGKAVKIEAVTGLVFSFTAMLAAVYMLATQVDPKALAGVLAAITAFAFALTKIFGSLVALAAKSEALAKLQFSLTGVAALVLAVAAGALLLANAFAKFMDAGDKINIGGIVGMGSSFILAFAVVAGIIAFIKVLDPFKPADIIPLLGMAVMVVAMAEAINIIASAFNSMSDIPMDKLQAMLVMIPALGLMAMGMAAVEGYLKSSGIKMAASLTIFAGGLYAMAKVFSLISEMENIFSLQAFATLGVAIGALVALGAIGRFLKVGTWVQMGLAAIEIAIAIGALAQAMKMIRSLTESMNSDDVNELMGLMDGLGNVLAKCMALAGVAAALGKGFVPLAGIAYVEIAAGILLLANALGKLAAIKSGDMERALGAFDKLAATLAGAIGAITIFSVVMALLGKHLVVAGLGMMSLGVGIALVTVSLEALGLMLSALPWQVEAFVRDSLTAFDSFLTWFNDFGPKFADHMEQFIAGEGPRIMLMFGEVGAQAIVSFAVGLAENAVALGLAVSVIVTSLVEGLIVAIGESIGPIADALILGLAKLIMELCNSIKEYGPYVVEAAGMVLDLVRKAIYEGAIGIIDSLKPILDGLGLGEAAEEWKTILGGAAAEMERSMQEHTTNINNAWDEMAKHPGENPIDMEKGTEEAKDSVDDLAEHTSDASDKIQTYSQGAADGVEAATQKISEALRNAGIVTEDAKSGYEQQMGSMLAATAGFEAGAPPSIANAWDQMVGSTRAGGDQIVSQTDASAILAAQVATRGGGDLARGYGSGINDNMGSPRGAINTMAGLAMNAYYGNLYSTGYNLSQGLANGLWGGMGAVRAAVSELASLAARAIEHRNEIKSPSRLMMRLGRYITKGYAIGIASELPAVNAAVDDLASRVSGKLSGMNLDTDIWSDVDFGTPQPVVRPVLDASDVERGLSTLSVDGQVLSAGWSGSYSRALGFGSVNNVTNNYNVHQAYNAGDDAFQLFMGFVEFCKTRGDLVGR